jgi:hypothetical protein
MEFRDVLTIIGITVAAAGVLVAWLKYRHDVIVRKEQAKPHPVQPYVNVIHAVTRSSFRPDEHNLKLEISNRDEKPIAVKEVCWYVKSFRVSWPLTYKCTSLLPEVNALHDHRLETAQLLQLDVDFQNIFEPLWSSGDLPLLDTMVGIATLDMGVILTTGEFIPLRTPWTFRAHLASQLVRPSWLAPLVRLYVWAHP